MRLRRALPPVVLAVAAVAGHWASTAQETGPPATTASPHGDLAVPCAECHTATGWRPLREPLPFDHGDAAGFPLVAGHRGVECLACHGDLRFERVASACADCHLDPHRRTLGFACESCHSPAGWEDRSALRDRHAATLFPLTGAHASVDCEACHRLPPPAEFAAAPVDCFACHAADFRSTREPDHVRAGFPTDCEVCHSTSTFVGADFRAHDSLFFPIFSGPHAGVWGACTDCHRGGGFQSFSCLACHEHRRSEMDDEHDDVPGYRYESSACLACHPTGRE